MTFLLEFIRTVCTVGNTVCTRAWILVPKFIVQDKKYMNNQSLDKKNCFSVYSLPSSMSLSIMKEGTANKGC